MLRAVLPRDRLPGPEVWVIIRRKVGAEEEEPDLIAYQQRHNYAAYCSHRKRLLARLQGLRW